MRNRILTLLSFLLAGGVAVHFFSQCKGKKTREVISLQDATFAGGKTCLECHKDQYDLWMGSHHQLAMDEATDSTVLGDFNNAIHVYYGDTSRFYKKNGKFYVYTRGSDFKNHEYLIKYTFGWTPLQQYLVEFPGGRYQVLPLCWHSIPEKEGGQKWFHIYPDEYIDSDDILHWTGIIQNWNFMCAECHSTNLKKNYNSSTDAYHTSWKDISVDCEACHGPGSLHNQWATLHEAGENTGHIKNKGLVFSLKEDTTVSWDLDTVKGTAFRSKLRSDYTQINLCARCHSRRLQIWDDYVYGGTLLQTHRPQVLTELLYYYDGQIKDEDYVWGSFLQSKMYAQGVTCTDCHDPHTAAVIVQGNTLCLRCHSADKYHNEAHHFHKLDSTGAGCADCHMPETHYMVVDPRRDHSIRIPRPDLSVRLNIPNACNICHSDRSYTWAAGYFKKWYGDKYQTRDHFAVAFAEAHWQKPGYRDRLTEILHTDSLPDIIRASGISYMMENTSPQEKSAILNALKDKSSLVRLVALEALYHFHTREHLPLVLEMANDPERSVRIEAARILSSYPQEILNQYGNVNLDAVMKEYERSAMVNSDRPASHIFLGILYANRNDLVKAEKAYLDALQIDAGSVEALANLVDIYREQGRDSEGEQLLLNTLTKYPEAASLYHTLGLLYIRLKRTDEALNNLKKAVTLAPEDARFRYVYAIALNSTGNTDKAVTQLKENYKRHPYHEETLYGLTTILRDQGKLKEARYYAEKFQEVASDKLLAQQVLRSLR